MKNWITNETEASDIIISSRVRIARNIKGKLFPHKVDLEHGRELVKDIEKIYLNINGNTSIHLWEIDKLKQSYYLEKHLISSKLIENFNKGAFIHNEDETVSTMINEEDHIRIQCISSGFNLEEAYRNANFIDDLLEENIDFSFYEKFGYITACPTNVGTGLRVSAMIHLPVLTMNNEINNLFSAITQLGMTIRGLYGEGSKAYGNLYQVSNQITLGQTEEEIILNLKAVVYQIVNQENHFREKLMSKYKYEIQDKVYRALGVLKNSILLDSRECLKLLS